jgi:hypothetical protein
MASSSRRARQPSTRLAAALHSAGPLLGTIPLALLASVGLARFLPLREDARFVVGFSLAIPLWVAAMCIAFVVRSGFRVWLLAALSALVLIGLSLAAHLP